MIAIRPCDPLCDMVVSGGKRLLVYVLISLFDDELLRSTSDHLFVGKEEEVDDIDDAISLIVDEEELLLSNDTICG